MLRTDTTIRTWSITSHLNRTSLVTKGFTLWHNRDLFLPGPTREILFAYSGSHSELRISLITTAVKRLNRYFCFLLLGFHLPVREKWKDSYVD